MKYGIICIGLAAALAGCFITGFCLGLRTQADLMKAANEGAGPERVIDSLHDYPFNYSYDDKSYESYGYEDEECEEDSTF